MCVPSHLIKTSTPVMLDFGSETFPVNLRRLRFGRGLVFGFGQGQLLVLDSRVRHHAWGFVEYGH